VNLGNINELKKDIDEKLSKLKRRIEEKRK
jgi:hypothetical protein